MATEVAAPEPVPELPSSPNGLKRPRSPELAEEEEKESKRQRTNGDTTHDAESRPQSTERPAAQTDIAPSTTAEAHTTSAPTATTSRDRKKSKPTDEKQRSKRLFGALLGNLNQPSGSETSRRRQEIEARRKAELKRQDEEREDVERRKREEVTRWRRGVQARVEEGEMRARHTNMRERAGFLSTRVGPKLYYRPWELVPEEEDRLEQQIKDTEAQIDREVEEFEVRRGIQRGSKTNGTNDDSASPALATASHAPHNETANGESKAEVDDEVQEAAKSAATNNNDEVEQEDVVGLKPAEVPNTSDADTNPASNNNANTASKENEVEEEKMATDENFVEGDEDTVIY